MRNTLRIGLTVLRLVVAAITLVAAVPRSASAQERDLPTAPVTDFWSAIGDPVLEALVRQALEGNHDLAAAESRVREARAAELDATLAFVPSVTAVGGFSRQQFSRASAFGSGFDLPNSDLWEAGLQLSWEVDLFGRLNSVRDARRAFVDSSEEDVRDARLLIATEVARAYFALRAADERSAVAQRNAENQQRTLEVTRDRLELGRGNALETESAEAQLSSTLAILPALDAERTVALHRLNVLLGGDPAVLALASEPTGVCGIAFATEVPDADVEARIQGRPDVVGAERRLAARRAAVDAASAEYRPRVSIGGAVGYTAAELDELGHDGTPRYVIGPTISWPLLDLGRVSTRVDAARAGETEAAARYSQALLIARLEVESSRATYESSRERLRYLEAAASASERATELARLRFEEGVTDFLEVLDAERRQLEAEDRAVSGCVDAANALVSVYRSLGGTWGDYAR